jgi:FkbH-like protein
MSTRRLTVEQIRKYASSSDHVVLAVFMIDRFTDHGLVAYVNAEIKKEELVIKDFIMSCRVFSRTLEFYALKSLLKTTSKYKCKVTRFRLKKTEKNLPFQSFLKNLNIENENTTLISNQILNKRSKTFIN